MAQLNWSIQHLTPADLEIVLEAVHLFDHPPTEETTRAFLAESRHHMFMALTDEDDGLGFITGVEMLQPDKGWEMLVYELGVDESVRRQGIGRALVDALVELAARRGCRSIWVVTEPDNEAARATYAAAGLAVEPTITFVRDLPLH